MDTLHQYTHLPSLPGSSGGGAAEPSGAPPTAAAPLPSLPLLPSPDSLSATIAESMALLQQVRQSVAQLTGNVQDGSLQRLSQQLADSRQAPPRRRPYSMLLAQVRVWCDAVHVVCFTSVACCLCETGRVP